MQINSIILIALDRIVFYLSRMRTHQEINTITRIVLDSVIVNEGIGSVLNLDTLFSTLNRIIGY